MSASTRSEDVLIDLSPRAKLRLSGADRVRFLNGQVSNDVRKASASESVYTCVMTIKGKMCADAFVHAGEDFLLVDTEPELRESLAARLERYIIADDVEMADVTDDWQLFHILPAADDGKNTAAGPRLDDLPGDPVDAGKLHVVQSSRFGRAGIDLFVPILLADAYRSYLGGKFRFLSAEEAEHTRIAAGVPRWGVELGEDTMPAEAGLESRAVSYSKGCYIGQEVVSRVKSVGHVNWQLRGFHTAADVRLEPGMILRAVAADDGRHVGSITSVSPLVGKTAGPDAHPPECLALGYVRRGFEAAGTRLRVFPATAASVGSEPVDALAQTALASVGEVEVSTLPFPK